MNPLLSCFLQLIAASGILYGYYHFFLRNKKFHRYNRFYLLTATVISVIIPFLNIPVYFSQQQTGTSFVLQTLTGFSSSGVPENTAVYAAPVSNTKSFSWQQFVIVIYITVVVLLLLRVLLSLYKIKRIIARNPVKRINNIHFINTDEPGTPFSFFRWLFWHKKIDLHTEKGEQIFRHELFHINQRHSLDIIFLELLTVVFWINPFFHLIKKEVKAIHEFLADQFAIHDNKNRQYAELLLMQALQTQLPLVNPFFHNQIKRRIAMLTASSKPGHQYFRKLMVLPVIVITVLLFAFTYKEKQVTAKENTLQTTLFEKEISDTAKKPKIDTLIWYQQRSRPTKKPPSAEQLTKWGDPKIYGIWLDGKRIQNNLLKNYKPVSFALYNESKLAKNAVNYGKHYYQVDLLTHKYYEKAFENYNKNWPASFETDTIIPRVSLYNNNDPLLVIDGVIKGYLHKDSLEIHIDPGTIESINILKDKSAEIKYGTKGKNGVIEIKTKSKEPLTETDKPVSVDTLHGSVENKVFYKVEIEPAFPGGEKKWNQYLAAVLDKSVPVKNNAPKGNYSVVIQFIVNLDGTIKDIQPLTTHGYGMEEEAIRILKKGPRWEPAIQNGYPVVAYKKAVINFFYPDDQLDARATTPPAAPGENLKIPEITVAELKNATPYQLMQLAEGTEVAGFIFSVDINRGDLYVAPCKGNKFSDAAKKLITEITAGKLVTIDDIRIIIDGKEKKIASKAYLVKE